MKTIEVKNMTMWDFPITIKVMGKDGQYICTHANRIIEHEDFAHGMHEVNLPIEICTGCEAWRIYEDGEWQK